MVLRGFAVALLTLAGGAVAVILVGSQRWNASTRELLSRLEADRQAVEPGALDFTSLDGSPPPVQRYLRAVLTDGQPIVSAVDVEHVGTFNLSDDGDQWKPFRSTQRVVTRSPGFVWDARIAMAPGLAVHVRDAYIGGEGVLQGKVGGLVTVVDSPNSPELARGEMMRYLAEAAWYPTALMPGQGVRWDAVDDTSATATMSDGEIAVRMLFRFDDAGLIESVRAEDRGYMDGPTTVPMPWEGRLWSYERRDGMLVPLEGEAAWMPPEGPRPYWRGRIMNISYENAE